MEKGDLSLWPHDIDGDMLGARHIEATSLSTCWTPPSPRSTKEAAVLHCLRGT